MAFTVTQNYRFSEGNKIRASFDVTADAASGSIATGFNVVDSIEGIVPISMATAAGKFRRNLSAASATANGTVMVSSVASGDNFTIICIGH